MSKKKWESYQLSPLIPFLKINDILISVMILIFLLYFFEAVCHANCGGVRKPRTPFPSIKTNLLISSSLFLVISVTT